MFFPRICRYSLGNLQIQILKVEGKCTIYQTKGYQGSLEAGNLTKKICMDGQNLTYFENLAPELQGVDGNIWN